MLRLQINMVLVEEELEDIELELSQPKLEPLIV